MRVVAFVTSRCPMPYSDDWSTPHDLALVFAALAHGADLHVDEMEIASLSATLARWLPDASDDERVEVLVGALGVLVEADDRRGLLLDALRRLYDALSAAERERALLDAVALAEADGRLLGGERDYLRALADAWHLRAVAERRLAATTASREEWTKLHDIAIVLVAATRGSTSRLGTDELSEIRNALEEWQPGVTADEVDSVLRRVLHRTAEAPTAFEPSLERLASSLTLLERLGLLSDLVRVAHADGDLTGPESDVLATMRQVLGLARTTV